MNPGPPALTPQLLMADLAHHVRDPGDGADRPDASPLPSRYVYVARSRRSGGLSLGVDLTPQGHCSFSCVYCQASHPPLRDEDLRVEVARLRDELMRKLLDSNARELRDLVLAGSGEPTSVPNVSDALAAIRAACDVAAFSRPRRVFTNGRHLAQVDAFDALVAWLGWGGEVWVKLDAASSTHFEAINGRRFDAASHLENIWRLARVRPIGVQTMVLHSPSLPAPADAVDEVTRALVDGVASGALIREVHLITLSRVPSNAQNALVLRAIEADELEELGQSIAQATGLTVRTYPAQ